MSAIAPNKLRRMSRKRRAKIGYDKKLCHVYGLRDAFGRIGYVGQTRIDLKRRLRLHFRDAEKGKTPVNKWINSTMGVEIFMIDSNATWDVSEILWIDRYRREGHDLCNVLRGGGDTIHAIKREAKEI